MIGAAFSGDCGAVVFDCFFGFGRYISIAYFDVV